MKMKQRNKNLPKVKYKLKVNGVTNLGNVDITAIRETPDMKLEELSEGKLINLNEKSGCDTKKKERKREGRKEEKENFPEEVTVAKNKNKKQKKKTSTLKVLMGIFHNIQAQKIKYWKLIQSMKGI